MYFFELKMRRSKRQPDVLMKVFLTEYELVTDIMPRILKIR